MLQLQFFNFRKNSYILVEGAPAQDHFFIIRSGHVVCCHENEVPGSGAVTLGPGDFIGVIPCMSGHSQVETVVALTDVSAICVKRDQYSELIMHNTPVAMKIIRTFARNMRAFNENLTAIALKKTSSSTTEHIFEIADYYDNIGQQNIATYGYYQYLKSCPGGINFETAKRRFIALKPSSNAVYLEGNNDMVRVYPKNTMIFSESMNGADMFIIQEGSVRITKVVEDSEVTLALLKKGDMFGEMALLENKPRSASAIAHEECRVMVINRKNFEQMVTTQPQLISRLTTMLSERLWAMYRQLSNTQLHDLYARIIDMISLQIEKLHLSFPTSFQYFSNLAPADIFNMCAIPYNQQNELISRMDRDSLLKIKEGKIVVRNVPELIKQAAFFRKQNGRK